MVTFFEYLIKISLCYGVIYLFYFLLLKRFTHYIGNRFFLLISSAVAFVIPVIRIDLFVAPQTISSSSFINKIPVINANGANVFIPGNDSLNITFFLSALLVAGAVICAAHLVI